MTVSACARLSRSAPHPDRLLLRVGPGGVRAAGLRGGAADSHPQRLRHRRLPPRPRGPARRAPGARPRPGRHAHRARRAYDPFKDHANFLRAAAALKGRLPDVHFLLCGYRVDPGNETLASMVAALGLRGHCHLLGPRRDVPRLQAGLDLATSSSVSEAFPLAIGEAMACGVPCVATDVGDSASIIGETGRVVPPHDPRALAAAWEELLALAPDARRRLGQAARLRVQERYELVSITRRYENVYETLCAGGGRSTAPVLPGAGPAPGYEASQP